MKILSVFLPGFHKETINDEAWGDGFTEWDNVKNGRKLYKNHYQPIKPLNENYYDLSNCEDLKKQIFLANKYNVDGFIFYHYWFNSNKKALYKPAEILLNEISDKIEYCFCWANHSWIKNWHGKNSEMIVEQEYGDEQSWIKHIDYLINFFKDDRYIKINGRPVIYIYNMSDIKCIKEMIKVWNQRLNENNLEDIYIIEYITSRNKDVFYEGTEEVVEFEPLYTTYFDISAINKLKRFLCKKFHLLDFQNYDNLWKKIIKRKRVYGNKKIQKGCFSGWDNSARKGHNSMIVKGASAEKFGKYLEKLIKLNRVNCNNDFIVINAWNEWSEGAILEPTEKDEYKYLEEIKKVKLKYGK